MVIRIGMIGLSEGNGHPFSFSAIINGYNDQELSNSGWKVIYDYVRKRDSTDFGFEGVKVTHAWTQDIKLTEQLCKACHIPIALHKLEDMIGKVDGVIIARDDFDKHFEMAIPFLVTGHYVFVDKPLSLNIEQLLIFKPYLENGILMSCSGMRYAKELDDIRSNLLDYGEIRLINGVSPNSWEKYGVHLLEAITNILISKPIAITALEANHSSVSISMEDGALIQINNLGKDVNLFKLDFIGTKKTESFEIKDNFSMFRRTIGHFIQQIKTGKRTIPPENTLIIMRMLIAGRISKAESRKVYLNEIKI